MKENQGKVGKNTLRRECEINSYNKDKLIQILALIQGREVIVNEINLLVAWFF